MRLHQSRLKIDRANAKIDEAKSALRSTGIHQFIARVDPDTGDSFIRLRLFDVDDLIHVIVGEATYQLRSSLDVAAVALARSNGALDVQHVYFPIAGSEHEFRAPKGRPQQKIDGLSQQVKDAIALIAPYPGGNDLLIALNDLCNTDKHNNLIASVGVLGNGIIGSHPGATSWEQMALAVFAANFASAMIKNRNQAVDGLEFKLSSDDGDAEQIAHLMTTKMPIAAGLLFSGTKKIDGCEVFETLTKMSALVESIIQKLEDAS